MHITLPYDSLFQINVGLSIIYQLLKLNGDMWNAFLTLSVWLKSNSLNGKGFEKTNSNWLLCMLSFDTTRSKWSRLAELSGAKPAVCMLHAKSWPVSSCLVDVRCLMFQWSDLFLNVTLSLSFKGHEKSRYVYQFHFTAWPDKGVPRFASSLVHFRHKVNSTVATVNGPIVVHCR